MDYHVNVVYRPNGSLVGRYRLPTGESDAYFGPDMGNAAYCIHTLLGNEPVTVLVFSKVTKHLKECTRLPIQDVNTLAEMCREMDKDATFIPMDPPTLLSLTTRITSILNGSVF